MNKQQQTQKEVVGDLEITRKITATETTEMEHKGTVQERVVKGPVQPSKPPVFTKKIQPCRVFENEQAKFEVEFDGEPMPLSANLVVEERRRAGKGGLTPPSFVNVIQSANVATGQLGTF
ncbi:unnamed protein product [Ceratitis capitata]|uniref:(Mediterranean fruit fly) hypothetical protein n=1 Tax=Ceratitis capitata TaxID=7213 RepID=A0A811UVY1_CERCA|nr:unnamed protein product [Ceratitis capitata]